MKAGSADSSITASSIWPACYISSPGMPENLIGFEEILADIKQLILNRQGEQVSILGPGGFGKTSLAHLIASDPEVRDHFRDGILWACPVDYVNEAAILGYWAEKLGADISRIPKVEERTSIIKGLLHDCRMLIILDGVRHRKTFASLACGGPNCVTLMTTRDELLTQDFSGSSKIWRLPGLSRDQAGFLLSRRAPFIDWKAVFEGKMNLDGVCFPPNVLSLIAGSQTAHQTFESSEIISETPPAANRTEDLLLPELVIDSNGFIDFESLLDWSVRTLPERAQEVFLSLISFAPEPDFFSRQAAIQVSNANNQDLDLLIARNLVHKCGERLFLPRAVAETLSRHKLPQNQKRHREYYLKLLTSISGSFGRISQIYGQCMSTSLLSKLEENRREMVNALSEYQEALGLWEDYRNCGELALLACQSHSLCQDEGRLCNNLGKATHMLGDKQVAINYYRLAEDLLDKEGDLLERALVMNNIASFLVENGELQAAQTELLRAIYLINEKQGSTIPAYLHNNLGKIYDDQNLPILAKDEYKKALQALEGEKDEELELTVRFNLALVYQGLGMKPEALNELQKVVDIEERTGHPNLEGDLKLLDKLRSSLSEPKFIQWLRKRLMN